MLTALQNIQGRLAARTPVVDVAETDATMGEGTEAGSKSLRAEGDESATDKPKRQNKRGHFWVIPNKVNQIRAASLPTRLVLALMLNLFAMATGSCPNSSFNPAIWSNIPCHDVIVR